MYTLLKNEGKILALCISSELQAADYDRLISLFEEKINQPGKINLYWKMDDFEGWDLAAI